MKQDILGNIDSVNDLSPARYQAITRTDADLLLIGSQERPARSPSKYNLQSGK